MKTITILAEQISDRALAAALPAAGVLSVAVSVTGSAAGTAIGSASYRRFRAARTFAANYRIDLVVDDDAVTSIFDGLDFAYGAGVFSDAEAWVNALELALSA